MKEQNLHTKALFNYIAFAPEEIQKKYYNGHPRILKTSYTERKNGKDKEGKRKVTSKVIEENKVNPDWYKIENNCGDSIFNGIIFRDNRVYLMNIGIYEKNNNYQEKYLEITDEFNNLLKKYNIWHLCFIIPVALKNYYKEYNLTEEILLYIITDNEQLLPKFRYKLRSNHSRHKKFCESSENDTRRRWSEILHKTVVKISNLDTFKNFRKERPQLFFPHIHPEKSKLPKVKNGNQQPDDLSKSPRKARTFILGTTFKSR